MYENFEFNERITVPNGKSKISEKKFTKSLTSFHIKKSISNKGTQQNTIKKTGLIKKDKNSKSKRIYFSSKKSNELGYMYTNPISPRNNNIYKELNCNPKKLYNIPSSDQRLYNYKNDYNLFINKYKQHSIINNKAKINKYKYNSINDKNINNKNIKNNNINISNNNSDTYIKKVNGASNNKLNNSINRLSEKYLNTIGFALTNNTGAKSSYLRFNGLNKIGLGKTNNNKSLSNLYNFSSFNSRNKFLQNIKEKNNKKQKENLTKTQNINTIKKPTLLKMKSNEKINSCYNLYSTVNTNKNNKKGNKSSMNNIINSNMRRTNTNVNRFDNNYYKFDESYKVKSNESNKNYGNSYNKDLLYETVDESQLNKDFLNQFNFFNYINITNQRNKDNNNKDGFNTLKTLNSIKSYQQSVNSSNNNINNEKNNNINIIENSAEKNKYAFQTFSGPFRKNFIKVNIIEKDDNKKHKNDIINNNTNIIDNNKKKLYTKNKSTKSANNLKKNIIENTNNLYMNKVSNNIDNNDYSNSPQKKDSSLSNKNIESYHKKQNRLFNSLINSHSNLKSENTNKKTNFLNDVVFPLNIDNSSVYIKKKSCTANINKNGKKNRMANKNNSTLIKEIKNNSVFSSFHNIHKNKNENKEYLINNYLYSPKNNIGNYLKNNDIVVSDYSINLKKIKARMSNLLNVYSLLALRSLNVLNDNKILDNNINNEV